MNDTEDLLSHPSNSVLPEGSTSPMTNIVTSPKPRRSRLSRRLGPWLLRAIVPVVALALWQLASARGMVSELILPRPADVGQTLWNSLIAGSGWRDDLWVTSCATIYAFLIGLAVGLIGGVLFAFFEAVSVATYPYVIAFQAFPKIAIAPLIIVWLGYGQASRIVIGASIAFFPVLTSTYSGLSEVGKDELNLLKSVRATRMQELRYLRMPNAMSYLLPSLDLAILGALLGVISGEIVGSNSGLGYLIQERTVYGDTAGIFAALIVLAAIGLTLSAVVVLVKRLLPRSVVPR